jgi:hypothetical protein
LIEALHDKYICVSPVFKGGRLYNPGDVLLLPKGTEYRGISFVPAKAPETTEEPPQKPKVRAKKKKATSEVEV